MSYALVSGASSGIGAAFARRLAAEGYSLILQGRRIEKLSALAAELRKPGQIEVVVSMGDLRDGDYLVTLANQAAGLGVEFLVNNAGYGRTDPFLKDDFDLQYGMIEAHCRAPMFLCHILAPAMVAKGRGCIVNVSSLAGEFAVPDNAVYIGSKSMLTKFTETLALELRYTGVEVQALLPGFTLSDFHERLPHFGIERKSKGIVRWQTPEKVVAESFGALKRGKIVHISGWSNRLIHRIVKLIPKKLAYAIATAQRL